MSNMGRITDFVLRRKKPEPDDQEDEEDDRPKIVIHG
jgi:hypothetical protein